MDLRSILKLDFMANWRTLTGVGIFAVCSIAEWAGLDVPYFTALPPVETISAILVALGIYGKKD